MSSLAAILTIAFVHAGAGAASVLRHPWQSRLLSAAAGISVAYVIVDLMPEVVAWQQVLSSSGPMQGLPHQTATIVLAGFIVAFWIETVARRTLTQRRAEAEDESELGTFRANLATAFLMNLMIGYAVAAPSNEPIQPLWLFAGVMALYSVVNDHALAEHHPERYRKRGRWLLVAALFAGWIVGTLSVSTTPHWAFGLLTAYLLGGIMFNVMRHQLPYTERPVDALAFAAAAIVYGGLALSMSIV
jgi:multisubunit Na+/H+ antiporter MnhE subunit